jgi:hypothetical protein
VKPKAKRPTARRAKYPRSNPAPSFRAKLEPLAPKTCQAPSYRQAAINPFGISYLNAKLNLSKAPIDSTRFAKLKT